MKYQRKLSGVKVFAASHTSGSLIHPIDVPGMAQNRERTLLEMLGFTEELVAFAHASSLPCLESRAVAHQRTKQRGLQHPGLTSLAPQAVLHSYGPHPSSRALLHKAHHPGWYGPHLPLEALSHSPAFPPCWRALPHPPTLSPRSSGHLQQLPAGMSRRESI